MNSEINSLTMKSIVLTLKQEEVTRQKRSYISQLTLLFLFISLLFLSTRSFGQCEMKFEYEVENVGKINNSISIRISSGVAPFKIAILDLETNKNIKLIDESSNTFSIPAINSGKYALRIRDAKGCRRIEEIEVGGSNNK
jgi:hypothetical protein